MPYQYVRDPLTAEESDHLSNARETPAERLDPDEFQRGFLRGIEALQEATGRQVVASDGTSRRRSFDRAQGQSAWHLGHAWATADHLLPGQVAVDEKSHEITAIPKLLKLGEISGAIVTIDALGCPKEIARTIREQGADSVLAWKGHHEHLVEPVVAFWDGACARGVERGTASAPTGNATRATAGPWPGGAG
jgi:hypothetical protein